MSWFEREKLDGLLLDDDDGRRGPGFATGEAQGIALFTE
jgi:hypothetical protein